MQIAMLWNVASSNGFELWVILKFTSNSVLNQYRVIFLSILGTLLQNFDIISINVLICL